MANKVEVLLREHVQYLGKCGDVVVVAAGYARNYLFPRSLATVANDDNKKQMARRRSRLDAEDAARTAELDKLVAVLAAVTVTTKAKADAQGHLYGSVNADQIAELLTKSGHPTEEKHVRLDAPLKTVGKHAVKVHVHGERTADVTVVVEAELGEAS
ncbi:MAG: 50S ribosomal protein L9 [Planctomycetes bacterium]|nr:50S ribosomal protein L9 [Planctomycetota bacterium]